jgi:hypothetical protein
VDHRTKRKEGNETDNATNRWNGTLNLQCERSGRGEFTIGDTHESGAAMPRERCCCAKGCSSTTNTRS